MGATAKGDAEIGEAIFYGVSVGPGDPGLVTLKAVEVLEACQTIAAVKSAKGATVAYDIAKQAAKIGDKRTIDLHFAMTKDKDVLKRSHQEAADAVIAELESKNSVAMPVLGDASIFATYTYVKDIVAGLGYTCKTIPGVPSFCAISATLDQTLTPAMDTPLHIVPAGFSDLEAALSMPGTKVIMKAGKPLEQLKALLRERGEYDKASAIQNCGLADEHVAYSLDELEGDKSYFTTVIVRP